MSDILEVLGKVGKEGNPLKKWGVCSGLELE